MCARVWGPQGGSPASLNTNQPRASFEFETLLLSDLNGKIIKDYSCDGNAFACFSSLYQTGTKGGGQAEGGCFFFLERKS